MNCRRCETSTTPPFRIGTLSPQLWRTDGDDVCGIALCCVSVATASARDIRQPTAHRLRGTSSSVHSSRLVYIIGQKAMLLATGLLPSSIPPGYAKFTPSEGIGSSLSRANRGWPYARHRGSLALLRPDQPFPPAYGRGPPSCSRHKLANGLSGAGHGPPWHHLGVTNQRSSARAPCTSATDHRERGPRPSDWAREGCLAFAALRKVLTIGFVNLSKICTL